MTESLYIFDNGIRKQLDIKEPSGITLSFNSALFGDLSSVKTSHSYTFELPLTSRNREVFGLIDDVRETESNLGKKFKCLFLVDGFDLCRNAYLYINSVKDGVCSAVMTFNVIEGLKAIKDNDVSINKLTSNDIENNPNALIKDGQLNMDVIEFLESSEEADLFDNTKKAVKLHLNCGIVDERTTYKFNDSVTATVGLDYGVVAIEDFDSEEERLTNLTKNKILEDTNNEYGGVGTNATRGVTDIPHVRRVKADECRYFVPVNQILHRIEELYGLKFDFLEEKKYNNDDIVSWEHIGQSIDAGEEPFLNTYDEKDDLFNWGAIPIVTTRMSEELEKATAGTLTANTVRATSTGNGDNVMLWTSENGLGFYASDENQYGHDYWYEPYVHMAVSDENYVSAIFELPFGCDVTIKGRLQNLFNESISDKTLHLYSKADDVYVRENDGDITSYKISKSSSVDWAAIGVALATLPHDPVSYFIGDVFGWWTNDEENTVSVQDFEMNDDAYGSPWEIKELDPFRYDNEMPSMSPDNWVKPAERATYVRRGEYMLLLGNKAVAASVSGKLTISVNWGEGKLKHWVDIYSCLPDITCSEFVKSLFIMAGAAPIVKNDGSIGRFYYSDLYDNIPSAIDWSRKVLQTKELSYREDSAQHSYILMQNEDMESKNKVEDGDDVFEGDLWNVEINDKYLAKEKELYKLPYYGRWLVRGNAPNLKTGEAACVYQVTSNDLNDYDYKFNKSGYYLSYFTPIQHKYKVTLEANEMKPIFCLPRELYGKVDIWKYGQDDDKHIAAFKKMFSQPAFLNVQMLLTLEDLLNLDYSIPIYLSQHNSYFAIVKIEWHSESGVSDVQLCKIEL